MKTIWTPEYIQRWLEAALVIATMRRINRRLGWHTIGSGDWSLRG